jgi:hypothetical protein
VTGTHLSWRVSVIGKTKCKIYATPTVTCTQKKKTAYSNENISNG